MRPDLLAQSYDVLAHQWQEPQLQKNGLAQFERALAFLKGSGHALDIGCGSSSRFVDLLSDRGFAVEGLDVSEGMIALARESRPKVTFHHCDVSTWQFPRQYNFVSAWDSIWHLPLAEQEPVMRKICGALLPGGVFIFTTGGLDEPEEKEDSSMGAPLHYSVLGIPQTLELLARCSCVCRHLEYDQWPEKHLYVIAQKKQ